MYYICTSLESNSLAVNRLVNQANLDALIQEQERQIVEEHLEEIQHQKQEQEETDVAQLGAGENKDASYTEELADLGEITDQEKEEKPCDVTTDDETRVSGHSSIVESYTEFALNFVDFYSTRTILDRFKQQLHKNGKIPSLYSSKTSLL